MTLKEAPPRISVAGKGSGASPALVALAHGLGRALGERGAVVICGGLGGVMAGVCQGLAEVGGTSLGFLPGSEARSANPWVTLPLPTGLGEGRNVLVARCGEVLLAVGGGWGTLSEVALAQKLLIPVGVLGEGGFPDLGLTRFEDPESAAEWAVEIARSRRLS